MISTHNEDTGLLSMYIWGGVLVAVGWSFYRFFPTDEVFLFLLGTGFNAVLIKAYAFDQPKKKKAEKSNEITPVEASLHSPGLFHNVCAAGLFLVIEAYYVECAIAVFKAFTIPWA